MEFLLKTPHPITPEMEQKCLELAAKENKLVALKYLLDEIGRDKFSLRLWKEWIDEREPLIRALKENRHLDEVASFSFSDMISFAKMISKTYDITFDYSTPQDLVREYMDAKRDGKIFVDNLGK